MKLVIKNLKTLWWVIIGMRNGTTRFERRVILNYIRHKPRGCYIDGDAIYFQKIYDQYDGKYGKYGVVTTGTDAPFKIRDPLLIYAVKKIFKRYDTLAISVYFNLLTGGIKVYVVDMQEELLQ